MIEISWIIDLIEIKEWVDSSNTVDEETIIFELKKAELYFRQVRENTLTSYQEFWTSKQYEDFDEESLEIYNDFMIRLNEIYSELEEIWRNENEEYERIMNELKIAISEIEWKTQEYSQLNFEWNENMIEFEKHVYDLLWIEKETDNNWRWWKFVKWIIDEIVIWNWELIKEIYDSNWKVLIDMIDYLLSRDWLCEIAEQLWDSVWDLFSWDAYQTWRSVGELWLIWTWITAFVMWWRQLIRFAWKSISNNPTWSIRERMSQLSMKAVEIWSYIKNIPANLIGTFELMEYLWISKKIIDFWVEDFTKLREYRRAFEINDKLLSWENYAYLWSSATYILLKEKSVIPSDLDIAVNPHNIRQFIDNFVNITSNSSEIQWLKFNRLSSNKAPEVISADNIEEIIKAWNEWNLSISYELHNWSDIIEVELFPEIEWRWVTNLWVMDKWVVNTQIQKIDETWTINIPSLDHKAVAQWYLINFLDEFWHNSVKWLELRLWEWFGINQIKLKEVCRINNIICLLKDAGIIENLNDLLLFIDETIDDYNKLPNKSQYVQRSLDKLNIEEWLRKLKWIINDFYDDINTKLDNDIVVENPDLPGFKEFNENMSRWKIELFEMYKDYKERWWDELRIKLIARIKDYEWELLYWYMQIVDMKHFPYYYEIRNWRRFTQELKALL